MSREHPVSPEELMAFVDGQMESSEASKISQHLQLCADCAAVVGDAEQLSRQLAGWEVEEPSKRVGEMVVAELRGERQAVRTHRPRRDWWTGRSVWVYGLSGASAAVILLMVAAGPWLLRSRQPASEMSPSGTAGLSAPSYPQGRPAPQGQQAQQAQQGQQRKAPNSAFVPEAADASSPMVIRTIQLALITKEFDTARLRIDSIVKQTQGYIDQLTVKADAGSARGLSAILRLPSSQVEAGIAELKTLGRLTSESQNSVDITSQYVDLAARLSNARSSEQRLLRLLNERAGNLQDVVAMEREITAVRENIERMEAQQKGFENKVQFTTIQLELAEEYRAQLEPPAPGTGTQLRNALVYGVQSAAENGLGFALSVLRYGPVVLLWLIVLSPIGFLLWRFRTHLAD